MRALVAECVRYFMKPYCFAMGSDHIHTTRCWDEEFHTLREELLNTQSDVRALGNNIEELRKQLVDARATISVLKGERTGPPRFRWGDHVVQSMQGTDAGADAFMMRTLSDYFEKAAPPKPTPVQPDEDYVIKRFFTPNGEQHYRTPDGKRFNTREAAVRHMQLLRKRP